MLALLIPFSRMYLGVHTPLDVGVSFVLVVVLSLALFPVFRTGEGMRKGMPVLLVLLFLCGVAYALFAHLYSFPADVEQENLATGQKNAFMILGAALGFVIVYFVEKRWVNFDTHAPLAGQILKFVLGLALLIGLRAGLKAPLAALLPQGYWETGIRYFVMVTFAGVVWPLTFPLFQKIGGKKTRADAEEHTNC